MSRPVQSQLVAGHASYPACDSRRMSWASVMLLDHTIYSVTSYFYLSNLSFS